MDVPRTVQLQEGSEEWKVSMSALSQSENRYVWRVLLSYLM